MQKVHQYWIYIVSSPNKSTIYIGVTNNLSRRLQEHYLSRGSSHTFAGKYFCYNLVYYERFTDIRKAIAREKQLKGWSRKKKNWLIQSKNPQWLFYNLQFQIKQ